MAAAEELKGVVYRFAISSSRSFGNLIRKSAAVNAVFPCGLCLPLN